MADKDTPEDAGIPGEPLPDGPRSEGGPAARSPDRAAVDAAPAHGLRPAEPVFTQGATAAEALPEPLPLEPPQSSGEPDPSFTDQSIAAPSAIDTSDPDLSNPAPDTSDVEPAAEAPAAKALAETEPVVVPEALDPQPQAEPDLPSDLSVAAEEPAGAPKEPAATHEEPVTEKPLEAPAPAEPPPPDTSRLETTASAAPAVPTHGTAVADEPPAAAAPPAEPTRLTATEAASGRYTPPRAEEPEPESFTAAAHDLFRPSALDADDDPHIITLGRKFGPRPGAAASAAAQAMPVAAAPVAESPLAPAAPDDRWSRDRWIGRLRTAARYAAYAAAAYIALVLALIVLFRFVNPPGSMLMLTKLLTGNAVDRTWVPFEAISPALVRAVIVSEDSRFCTHRGVDLQAMRQAIEQAGRGSPRGASTISMQVTKNLFLWNAKSYLRKVIEIPLTLIMEVAWPKMRVMEVYLNVAEWGPGVFGAEAAAQHHFDKPASRLNEREAALLAAALPNPAIRVASNPGPRTSRMARVIQARVKAFGSVASCVVTAAAPTPPAAPAAATKPRQPARNTTPRKPAAQKPQATPQKQQKQKSNDWAPTLRFGPP